jgi:acetyl-CoA carboxylase biotin carboxyl carrier protein
MAAKGLLAPLPGIFYRRPSPEEAPFKEVGDAISAGDTLGLVEAMKSFFPVEAETSGKLVRFLVEDGEAVEAEQAVAEME